MNNVIVRSSKVPLRTSTGSTCNLSSLSCFSLAVFVFSFFLLLYSVFLLFFYLAFLNFLTLTAFFWGERERERRVLLLFGGAAETFTDGFQLLINEEVLILFLDVNVMCYCSLYNCTCCETTQVHCI